MNLEGQILALISVIFDTLVFFILLRQNFKIRHLLLLAGLGIISFIGTKSITVSSLSFLLEYLWLRCWFRNVDWYLFSSTYGIAIACDILMGLIGDFLFYQFTGINTGDVLKISVLIYLLTIVLLISFRKKIIGFINGQNAKAFCSLILYLSFTLGSIQAMLTENVWIKSPAFTIVGLFAVQIFFVVIIFIFNLQAQKARLDEQKMENYQAYLKDLEESEDSVRAFKHDYLNLLSTLKASAIKNEDQQLIEELSKYSQENLNQPDLWKYKNINHLENIALKGLMIDKISKMSQKNLKYSVECENVIRKLPTSVKDLDLVRVLGIAIDNAIEASLEQKDKKARVELMFYQENDHDLQFEVRNLCDSENLDLTRIAKREYTSKKNHHGFDLANIEVIKRKYPTMLVNYGIDGKWFVFDVQVIDE